MDRMKDCRKGYTGYACRIRYRFKARRKAMRRKFIGLPDGVTLGANLLSII